MFIFRHTSCDNNDYAYDFNFLDIHPQLAVSLKLLCSCLVRVRYLRYPLSIDVDRFGFLEHIETKYLCRLNLFFDVISFSLVDIF